MIDRLVSPSSAVLLAAATGLLAAPSLAFDIMVVPGTSRACPDLGRTVDKDSGKTHDPANPCGSVTIAGQTLVLPDCSTGYKWRKDTLWKSAPAPGFYIPNWNNPSVVETYYIADPCPAPPTTLEELEAMAESGVNCKEPVLTDTATDYGCAIPKACVTKEPLQHGYLIETPEELYPHAPRMDAGGLWVLDLDAPIQSVALPGTSMTAQARSTAHWPAETGTTGHAGMGLLASALELHGPLGSAELEAEVRYLFQVDGLLDGDTSADGGTLFQPAELHAQPELLHEMNRTGLTGRVQADGSFDLLLTTQSFERQTRAQVEHQRQVVLSEGHVFEGRPGAERMHAYPHGSSDRQTPLAQARFADDLAQWLGNPMQLSMEPGLVYADPVPGQVDGLDVQVVTVTGSSVPGLGAVAYSIAAGDVPLLVRIETKDPLGRTVHVQDFADHVELATGAWRALSLTSHEVNERTGDVELTTEISISHVGEVLATVQHLAAPLAERWTIHY